MNTWPCRSTLIALLMLNLMVFPAFTAENPDAEIESASDEVSNSTDEFSSTLEETIENVIRAAEQFLGTMDVEVERIIGEAEMQYEKAMKDAETHMESTDETMRMIEQSMRIGAEVARQLQETEINTPEIRIPAIRLPPQPFAPSLNTIREEFHGDIISTTQSYRFEAREDSEILVEAKFGDITAVSSDGSDHIYVLIHKSGGADTREEARTIYDEIQATVEENGNQVEIRVEVGSEDNQYYDSDEHLQMATIQLLVPRNTPLKIRNEFGKTHIAETGGPVECKNSFGPVLTRGTRGPLVIRNEFGETKVVNHEGVANVSNKFGAAFLEDVSGPLTVTTEYGDTTIRGLSDEAQLTATFSFGGGTLFLPATFRGRIDAASEWGDIEAPESLRRSEEMFSQSVKGTLSDGEGRIQLRSSFGSISIRMEES